MHVSFFSTVVFHSPTGICVWGPNWAAISVLVRSPTSFAILRGWYGAQRPLNPGNMKNCERTKKQCKIPHPGIRPDKMKKTEKKTKMGQI